MSLPQKIKPAKLVIFLTDNVNFFLSFFIHNLGFFKDYKTTRLQDNKTLSW